MKEPDEWGKEHGLTVETVGWCHSCETFQRYGARRETPKRRGLCVTEDCDETWAFGIWNMTSKEDFELNEERWSSLADRQESAYP